MDTLEIFNSQRSIGNPYAMQNFWQAQEAFGYFEFIYQRIRNIREQLPNPRIYLSSDIWEVSLFGYILRRFCEEDLRRGLQNQCAKLKLVAE